MAIKKLAKPGYGVLELNNVAFRRDGRIEAQCKAADTTMVIENGALLAVDNVTRTVKVADASDTTQIFALVYSAEHMYDDRANGLKDFALKATDDFLPRLGYLAVGDKFTENNLCYSDAEFSDEAALKAAIASNGTTAVYGGICTDSTVGGAILLSATAPTLGPVLKVVKGTTVPDGTYGVKLQVIKD